VSPKEAKRIIKAAQDGGQRRKKARSLEHETKMCDGTYDDWN
ncbi:11229_t:CDS:1, partial [Acaulospora morrowiae]